MDNERSAKINIGGTEYELTLTTRATKEIARRYGGLENLGEKLLKAENFELALDEIIWLITLPAGDEFALKASTREALRNGSATPKKGFFQYTAAYDSKHKIKVEDKKSARVYLEYVEMNDSEVPQ